MRVAVIDYREPPPRTAIELLESIKNRGAEPVYLKAHLMDALISDKVRVLYKGEEVGVDAALLRNLGFFMTMEVFAKRLGVVEALASEVPVVNSPSAAMIARDKWRCLLLLKKGGLPVPETLLTENPFVAMKFVEGHGVAVYKPIIGSLGLGTALLSDPDIAFHITRGARGFGIPAYLQKYLRKPGYDYRVFVVGDRVIGAMKRVSPSWKTNIAQGARGVAVREGEAPEVFELAIRAAKLVGLEYSGVDIAYDEETGEHYILELNAFPNWEGLRASTGVNPPDHIVDYIINKARK